MFCPNINNEEVIQQFNEIVESLGGSPLTAEEFKDGTLRNQREGADYAAMEAAYKIWDANNGNEVDKAPNGQQSHLFLDLLKHFNGNRQLAIKAKANTFSEAFKTWFGDWLGEDKTNVSKFVDQNGEPLVLWHGTENNFNIFNIDKSGKFGRHLVHPNVAFWFTDSIEKAEKYKHSIQMPVFLSSKNITTSDVKNFDNIKDSTDNESKLLLTDLYDGYKFVRFDKEGDNHGAVPTTQYVVKDPNQIKSIENNGNFSKFDDNIYNYKQTESEKSPNLYVYFENLKTEQIFDADTINKLITGEPVFSDSIIKQMIDKNLFSGKNKELAEQLLKHKIPILNKSLQFGIPAETIIDKNGNALIIVDKSLLDKISQQQLQKIILHETIHAITDEVIKNPRNAEERSIIGISRKLIDSFKKTFDIQNDIDVYSGAYALNDEYEFASVFMTDENARQYLFDLAKRQDIHENGFIKTQLKSFINKLVSIISNKAVFKTKQQELVSYQKALKDYIYNRHSVQSGIDIKSALKNNYNDPVLQNADRSIDDAITLNNAKIAFETHNYSRIQITVDREKIKSVNWDKVISNLTSRLLALKSSQLQPDIKNKLTQSTRNQIQLLQSQTTSKYTAVSIMAYSLAQQILDDVNRLQQIKNDHGRISDSDYQYQMNDNLGMYDIVLNDIYNIITEEGKQSMVKEMNQLAVSDNEKIKEEDVDTLTSMIVHVRDLAKCGTNLLNSMLIDNVAFTMQQVGEEVQSPEVQNYINQLVNGELSFGQDVGWFTKMFGAADSINNEAIKTLSHLISNVNDKVDESVFDTCVPLLKAQKDLKLGERVTDIYERDDKGRFTGYIVRKLNYGKFYKDYDDFLIKLNKDISDKYGIELDSSNRVAPDIDGAMQEFNKRRTKWLSDHCERKYVSSYYESYSKLSNMSRDAMQSINNRIFAINNKPGIIGEDGYPHYEKLSKEDYDELVALQIRKKILRSSYDDSGNLKVGEQLRIAKELQDLNKDLYGEGHNVKKDEKAWSNSRNAIIEECGGQKEYEKYKNGEENNFNIDKLDEWDKFNSRIEFKKDEDEQPLIFKDIQEEANASSPYYGKDYENIKGQIREMLNPYYGTNGEIIDSQLPQSVKYKVEGLQQKLNDIRRDALEDNQPLKKQSDAYGSVFSKYITFEDTEEYGKIKDELLKSLNYDLDVYNISLSQFGTGYFDFTINQLKYFRPFKWYQRMTAVDKEKYMEIKPGQAWVDKSQNNDFVNKNFDESQGTTFVPKAELYDNSKQYNKVMGSKSLRKLRDTAVNVMTKSNEFHTNRSFVDNYLLPQMQGNLSQRLRHSQSKIHALFRWLRDVFGINPNDTDFGQENQYTTDETGKIVSKESTRNKYSSRPNGKQFNLIPQPYTRKLDNPEEISPDLVQIITNYYRMSKAYEEKSKIKDTCETIVDLIKKQIYQSGKEQVGGMSGIDSNSYQFAKKFLEANLYDKRIKQMNVNIAGRKIQIQKTIGLLKRWTTARNLGMNPKIAVLGMLTAEYVHIVNAITGQKYDIRNGTNAAMEVFLRLIKNCGGANYVNNPYSNDKLMVMMETFDIADQFTNKFKDTNRSRILHAIYKNSIFGMLSAGDYLIKSQIAVSTLMSYRYVDGQFITKDDIRMQASQMGSSRNQYLKENIKKWKKGECLYNVIDSKNGYLICNEKYQSAWNKVKNVVKERAQKYSQNADGMATSLQRAAVTQNCLGALLLIHRQYLPLMLQERFSNTTYDYDMHQYKNGQFRNTLGLISQLTQASLLNGALVGGLVGSHFGLLGTALGSLVGIAYGIKGRIKHADNTKTVLRKNLLDFSKENGYKTQMIRYNLKQIMLEVFIFNALIKPAVASIVKTAEDADDDKYLLKMIAYWARSFEWESFTPYRFDDLFSNFKTVSPATSSLDNLEDVFDNISPYASGFGNSLFGLMFPRNNEVQNLFDLSSTANGDDQNDIIDRGTYEGHTRLYKTAMKLTPIHNAMEQYYDSDSKRRYIENQIMRKQN